MTRLARLSAVVSISRPERLDLCASVGAHPTDSASCRDESSLALERTYETRKKPRKLRLLSGGRYLKPGFVYSAAALDDPRWKNRQRRVAECGQDFSPAWHSGIRRDGKRFLGPVLCHAKEHRKCRPHPVRERIRSLDPKWFLTLTDRRRSQAKRVRDWRFGSVGRRLDRFFNMLRNMYEGLAYIWVRESHKSGFPHIHIVLNIIRKTSVVSFEYEGCDTCPLTFLPTKAERDRVEAMWLACGGGYATRFEHLRDDGEYIVPYLDKMDWLPQEIQALLCVNKLRDWSASKGVKAPRTELPYWYYERGKKELAEAHGDTRIDVVREELDEKWSKCRDAARQRMVEDERKPVRKVRQAKG